MRRSILITVLAALVLPAAAHDGVELSIKTRAAAASATVIAKQASAPFTYAHDPLAQLMVLDEQ
jgi:hypothetical protein